MNTAVCYPCLYPGHEHPFKAARLLEDEQKQWEEASGIKLINLDLEHKGTYSDVSLSISDKTFPPGMEILK